MAEALAADRGALGLAVAHTGSALALLFAADRECAARAAAAALGDAGLDRPVVFALAGGEGSGRVQRSESASQGS